MPLVGCCTTNKSQTFLTVRTGTFMGQILKEVVRSDQLKIPSDDKYYMCAYTSCHVICKQAGFAFDQEAFYRTHAVTAYKQARGSALCFPSIYDRFHMRPTFLPCYPPQLKLMLITI